ncbi:hypothetical protein ACSLVK_07325 [Photorhabdus tasmaniensis]|uniref:hypothetical protein n=1 Tax=Photorhabdus tasmaniensis TaxID=1004159 RepID=UPI0040434DF4
MENKRIGLKAFILLTAYWTSFIFILAFIAGLAVPAFYYFENGYFNYHWNDFIYTVRIGVGAGLPVGIGIGIWVLAKIEEIRKRRSSSDP